MSAAAMTSSPVTGPHSSKLLLERQHCRGVLVASVDDAARCELPLTPWPVVEDK